MDFMDVVRSRKSVRNFQERDVEDEKINTILESARLAPSWQNKQCWSYIIVRDKSKIDALSSGINSFIKKAPVLIVACGDPDQSGHKNDMDYFLVDVAIATQQLSLAAVDQGLGTCWLGAFDEAKVKETFNIPNSIKVVALIPIGYPAEKEGLGGSMRKMFTGSAKRKPIGEIVHREKW